MIVCKRVHYSGRVQGVGFRYNAQGIARRFPVAGYVRNLSDGQVELVAEGEADQVDGFLAAVAQQMHGCITSVSVEELVPGGLHGFSIRR